MQAESQASQSGGVTKYSELFCELLCADEPSCSAELCSGLGQTHFLFLKERGESRYVIS